MRHAPNMTSKYEREEMERLKAEPWMIELLNCNPVYCSWGPHEDYMMNKNREEPDFDPKYHRDAGWASRVLIDNWNSFSFELDDINECVNFYFEVNRESQPCEMCGGDGYHPDAKWVSDSWYQHSSPFASETARGREITDCLRSFSLATPSQEPLRQQSFPSAETLAKYGSEFRAFCEKMRTQKEWRCDITQDEVDALWKESRLRCDFKTKPTATQVNNWASGKCMGHDAINRGICIEARLERFSMPKTCPTCDGHGITYTEDKPHVSLVLWWLHPRKGCSRGIEIKRINQDEVPAVKMFLRSAAARNAERFSKL